MALFTYIENSWSFGYLEFQWTANKCKCNTHNLLQDLLVILMDLMLVKEFFFFHATAEPPKMVV